MALPAILAIISAIGSANSQGGGQQPITQPQGYGDGTGGQQPQQQGSLGTLQGLQPAGGQQQPRGNAMNTVQTIGNIAGTVNSLQQNNQQSGPYQMPYLRRRQ
jgi:hypothetical protein